MLPSWWNNISTRKMNTIFGSCVICGCIICDDDDPYPAPWLGLFRILYSSQNKIAVTGVGIYDDPYGSQRIAPLNFTARWDDTRSSSSSLATIGVLGHPNKGRSSFPFHESCWSILEKAYSPESIPCEALFEVCKSLPIPSFGHGLSWGHDFGGLVLVDNEDRYPWEDRFIARDGSSEHNLLARNDPYHIPEIQRLPYEHPQAPPATCFSRGATIVTDCFTVLPLEICIAIASYMSTVDALNARQASRSFLPIFYSQQFWSSRFRAKADRSWLFESQEWNKTRDWRWLYRRTNAAHRTGGMKNRERVWKLIQLVQGVLCLRWTESTITTLSSPDSASLSWLEAAGNVMPEAKTANLHEGCCVFHKQQTFIPDLLSQIAFSIIQLGDAEYIAGMRPIPSQGEAIQLGYRAEGRELILNVQFLAGFNLAVGSRGIQGIQCIVDNRRTSQWFGCAHRAPKTRRLAISSSITAIEAGFDGCKMVSLAVAKCAPLNVEKTTKKDKSLRDSAFWYPQIPGTDLYLNDHYFRARDSSTTRYQPLCWTMFGGPKGIYLRCLTGISVISWGYPRGIEFHYDTENVPVECRKLGRWKSNEYAQAVRFPIDGRGGEVIDAIEAYFVHFGEEVIWFYKQGSLESLKISTNRGRSYHFRQEKPARKIDSVSVKVAPGSVINGFYWSQHQNRLTDIGVISQVIKRTLGEDG